MSGTVVIGLGNPLMGDDGVGLAVLERLLLVDAIAAHGRPGEIIELSRDRLPIYLSRKLSPHQVDMRDALAVAELRGRLPNDVVAIGVQPETVALSSVPSATSSGCTPIATTSLGRRPRSSATASASRMST